MRLNRRAKAFFVLEADLVNEVMVLTALHFPEHKPCRLPAWLLPNAETTGFNKQILNLVNLLHLHFERLIAVKIHQHIAGPRPDWLTYPAICFESDR